MLFLCELISGKKLKIVKECFYREGNNKKEIVDFLNRSYSTAGNWRVTAVNEEDDEEIERELEQKELCIPSH